MIRWPCTNIFCVRLQRSLHKVVALSRVLLGVCVCVMLLFIFKKGVIGVYCSRRDIVGKVWILNVRLTQQSGRWLTLFHSHTGDREL